MITNKIKGKNTNTHEMVEYPFSQRRFKNHVHKKTKTNLMNKDVKDSSPMEATAPIIPIKKYTSAGKQKSLFGKNDCIVAAII